MLDSALLGRYYITRIAFERDVTTPQQIGLLLLPERVALDLVPVDPAKARPEDALPGTYCLQRTRLSLDGK